MKSSDLNNLQDDLMMEIEEAVSPVQALKISGDVALARNDFENAILHYTNAIDLSQKSRPTESLDILYSCRSRAFLKGGQYFYAFQDANRVVKLNPEWHEGYFRRGEVQMATKQYWQAIVSYSLSLNRIIDNELVADRVYYQVRKRHGQAWDNAQNDRTSNLATPWLGAGAGIITGVALMLADASLTAEPTHPLLMSVITISISIFGYGVGRVFRDYNLRRRNALLDPPMDYLKENKENGDVEATEEVLSEQKEPQKHMPPRYSKSQARLRYKKGKM